MVASEMSGSRYAPFMIAGLAWVLFGLAAFGTAAVYIRLKNAPQPTPPSRFSVEVQTAMVPSPSAPYTPFLFVHGRPEEPVASPVPAALYIQSRMRATAYT
jgi:hypothetical protein